jgi:hypothetical protein
VPIPAATAPRSGSDVRPVWALPVLFLCALAAPATAAEWGAITPAKSTMDAVRAQYGGPTRVQNEKLEGYDSTTWTYEGTQAPAGMNRMIVDFGLVGAGGYRRDIVRAFRLEPRAGAFSRSTILSGWGLPARVGTESDGQVFFYSEGLLVYFEKESPYPRMMIFTPPQPIGEEPAKKSP